MAMKTITKKSSPHSSRSASGRHRKKPLHSSRAASRRKSSPHSSRSASRPPAKALVLLSGGLDSRLVCKILEEQLGSQQVEAVFFALPFGGGCCADSMCVIRFCQLHGYKLHVVDCTRGAMFKRYMAVIKEPKFGRGVAMNPCIDCHLFMLKEAKKIAKKIDAGFLATGEVLGERPLSQHRQALDLIERQARLEGRLLRPLSAKLLAETEAEKKGWVKREKLFGIGGRGRAPQLELAKKFGIDFPSPGGGCLLTDSVISGRLLDMLSLRPNLLPEEVELVKLGRHFAVAKGTAKAIIIVGRNHDENIKIADIAKDLGLPTLEVNGFVGPTTAVWGVPSKPIYRDAAMLTARYSDAPKGLECAVCVISGKTPVEIKVTAPHDTGFINSEAKKPKVLSRKTKFLIT